MIGSKLNYQPVTFPPETVGESFVAAWLDGTFWPHFVTTMIEIVLGFVVGAGLALVVGYGLARSVLFERLASPYLVAAQAIPILALAPLFVVWFGSGLLEQGRDLRAHRLLPGRDRDDGRDPLGRCRACSSSGGACGRPRARS